MFLKAYNEFMIDKEALIEDCKLMIETIADVSSIDEQISRQIDKLEEITKKVKELASSNASTAEL